MAEGLFHYEGKKIKVLVYLHIVLVVLFALLNGAFRVTNYRAGYYAAVENPYAWMFIVLCKVFFLLLILAVLSYVIVPLVLGLKYFLPSFGMVILSFLLTAMLWLYPTKGIAGGYYDYAKDKIRTDDFTGWLASYEMDEYATVNPDGSKDGRVLDFDWPECIKVLNPDSVLLFEKDSKRYVRLIYRFNWGLDFGLCVAEEGVSVPLYDYDEREDRIAIRDNVFVWVK